MSNPAAVVTHPSAVTLGWVWRSIQADLEEMLRYSAHFTDGGSSRLRRLSFMLTPPVMCAATYRLSHWLYRKGLPLAGGFVSWVNFLVHRADVSCAAEIGPGLYIPHTSGVVFRGRAGAQLTLLFRSAVVGAGLDARRDRIGRDCPRLGDGVTVGVFSTIKGAVTIGDHAYVGAVSTVVTDLPSKATVVIAGRRALGGRV